MTKFLYPEQYCEYLVSKLDIRFHYTCFEAWLKRDGKWLFIASGDNKKEAEEAAKDVLKTLVDVNTMYEVCL